MGRSAKALRRSAGDPDWGDLGQEQAVWGRTVPPADGRAGQIPRRLLAAFARGAYRPPADGAGP